MAAVAVGEAPAVWVAVSALAVVVAGAGAPGPPPTAVVAIEGAEVKPVPPLVTSMAWMPAPEPCAVAVNPPDEIAMLAAVQPDVPLFVIVKPVIAPLEIVAVAAGVEVHPMKAITTAAEE